MMQCFQPNPQHHCGIYAEKLHHLFREHALAAELAYQEPFIKLGCKL
jgi:hypothetical protein